MMPRTAAGGLWHRLEPLRPRLLLAILAGTLAGLYFSSQLLSVRLLIGWDAMVLIYLMLLAQSLSGAEPAAIRERAQRLDAGSFAILLLASAAAVATMAAIGSVMATVHSLPRDQVPAHIAVAALTIVPTWIFLHVVYAVHYAHEYYYDFRVAEGVPGGLIFPSAEKPDYWDFLYFSLVIGMTAQVSDVQVSSQEMRRIVLGHSVLSYFFNTVILALGVNIAASSL